MLNPIKVLEREGVRTTSYIGASQDIMDKQLSARERLARISDLIGFLPDVEMSDLQARYFHAYIVNDIVKAHLAKEELTDKRLLDISLTASKRADTLHNRVTVGDMKYVTAMDEDGESKRREFKDGKNKQELAYDIYVENIALKRMDIIILMMEALDMSKAGATTYYQNSKKQFEESK